MPTKPTTTHNTKCSLAPSSRTTVTETQSTISSSTVISNRHKSQNSSDPQPTQKSNCQPNQSSYNICPVVNPTINSRTV